MGRVDEGLERGRQSVALNPRSYVSRVNLAWHAAAAAVRSEELPEGVWKHLYLAVFALQGDAAGAVTDLYRHLELNKNYNAGYGPTRVWNSVIEIVTGFPATSVTPSMVTVCSARSTRGVCGVITTVRS